jgi:hypothetical protein
MPKKSGATAVKIKDPECHVYKVGTITEGRSHSFYVLASDYQVADTLEFYIKKNGDEDIVAVFKNWVYFTRINLKEDAKKEFLDKGLDSVHPDDLPKTWGQVDGKKF